MAKFTMNGDSIISRVHKAFKLNPDFAMKIHTFYCTGPRHGIDRMHYALLSDARFLHTIHFGEGNLPMHTVYNLDLVEGVAFQIDERIGRCLEKCFRADFVPYKLIQYLDGMPWDSSNQGITQGKLDRILDDIDILFAP